MDTKEMFRLLNLAEYNIIIPRKIIMNLKYETLSSEKTKEISVELYSVLSKSKIALNHVLCELEKLIY